MGDRMTAMRDEAADRSFEGKVRFAFFAIAAKSTKGGKRKFAALAKDCPYR